MLKNFWYACEFSSAVTSKPRQVRMLSQRFVLYRSSHGQVVALKDQCPHRGAALSLGWVEDECIRCPYHGWKFQSDGKCIDIPANASEVPIPKKAYLETYPVEEKYGFVWLFYGDLPEVERPPIPPVPEFEDSTLHPIFLEVKFNTHYTRVIENALDPAHMATVHANSFGAGFAQNPKVANYEVQRKDWGISAKLQYENFTKPRGMLKLFFRPSRTEIKAKTSFYLPNITKIESNFGRGRMINYAVHIPIDENTTISKRIQFRSFGAYRWADNLFLKLHYKVCEEDKVVSESQYPRVIPDNLSDEIHTPSDALSLSYRKLRQKYLAMGWGLERDQSESDKSNGYPALSPSILLTN